MDTAEETLLALLLWHVDASDSELNKINIDRDDVLRLARSFDYECGETRKNELIERGKAVLMAYRHGQMDGPRSKVKAA